MGPSKQIRDNRSKIAISKIIQNIFKRPTSIFRFLIPDIDTIFWWEFEKTNDREYRGQVTRPANYITFIAESNKWEDQGYYFAAFVPLHKWLYFTIDKSDLICYIDG